MNLEPILDEYVLAKSKLGIVGRGRTKLGILLAGAAVRVVPDSVLEALAGAVEEAVRE